MSIDPFEKEYPWNSPYAFSEDDPVNFIDLDGLEKVKHKLTNMDNSTYTSLQVYNSVLSHPDHIAQEKKGGSGWLVGAREYAFIVTYEGLSKKMYDNDGDPKGNATIGFGHLIHEGKIGNTETNKKLEEPFKDGITYEEAITFLIHDIQGEETNVNRYLNSAGITDKITGRQFTALVDLAFNMGQSRAEQIVQIVKAKGWEAAIEQLDK